MLRLTHRHDANRREGVWRDRLFEGIVSKVRTATHSGAKKLHMFRWGRRKKSVSSWKDAIFTNSAATRAIPGGYGHSITLAMTCVYIFRPDTIKREREQHLQHWHPTWTANKNQNNRGHQQLLNQKNSRDRREIPVGVPGDPTILPSSLPSFSDSKMARLQNQ